MYRFGVRTRRGITVAVLATAALCALAAFTTVTIAAFSIIRFRRTVSQARDIGFIFLAATKFPAALIALLEALSYWILKNFIASRANSPRLHPANQRLGTDN